MARTADHRGRRVRLLNPVQLENRGIDPKSFKIPDVGHLPSLGGFWSRLHWTYPVFVLSFFASFVALFMLGERIGIPGPWIVWFSFVPACFGCYLAYNALWWRRVLPRHVQQILASGYCPSCAFSLEGLVVESDGCVVCPECGAAWKR